MLLKKWEELPECMQNEDVEKYYRILKRHRMYLICKRLFDVLMSSILLFLLSPIFLILAIWIKLDSSGHVFFKQERVTQYGVCFKIYKFRTMVENADKIGALVTSQNDKRITKLGKKIRSCRLDELPQLINVVKGDMSFVGTRPEVMKYVKEYRDDMKATLLLPAGITSLASIKFKYEDELIKKYLDQGEKIDAVYCEHILPEKMKINLEYLEKISFMNDVLICIKTIIPRGEKK